MKVLVIGATGMLGHKLVQVLSSKFEVFGTVRGDAAALKGCGIFDAASLITNVDVTDEAAYTSAIDEMRPDVVVNAAGVVKQVSTAKSVVPTLLVNSIFPHRLAELSGRYGFRLITISTDCVFSGDKGGYIEGEVPDALDLYGKSKQFGEIDFGNALTLRTSIIGRELSSSHGLLEWLLANRGGSVKGFTNAIFSGFPTVVLADIVLELIENHRELSGLYHLSSDAISKFDLLTLIKEKFDLDIEILPSGEFCIDRSLDSGRFRAATEMVIPGWDELIDSIKLDPTPYEEIRSALGSR